MNERSGARKQIKQSRASEWVRDVSKRAHGRAVLTLFLVVLNQSELVVGDKGRESEGGS